MSNPKGNQKHLTLSQRIKIEKGLLAGDSFSKIAKILVRLQYSIIGSQETFKSIRTQNTDFAPIPCTKRKDCDLIVS